MFIDPADKTAAQADACISALRVGLVCSICSAVVDILSDTALSPASAASTNSFVNAAAIPLQGGMSVTACPRHAAAAELLRALSRLLGHASEKWPTHASCNPFGPCSRTSESPPHGAPSEGGDVDAAAAAHAGRVRLGFIDLSVSLCSPSRGGISLVLSALSHPNLPAGGGRCGRCFQELLLLAEVSRAAAIVIVQRCLYSEPGTYAEPASSLVIGKRHRKAWA